MDKELVDLIIEFRQKNNIPIKSICNLFKISRYKYNKYCRHDKRNISTSK